MVYVDGAYGARSRRATRARRELFDGWTRTDSVSLDPHKWLYAPVARAASSYASLSVRARPSPRRRGYIKVFEQARTRRLLSGIWHGAIATVPRAPVWAASLLTARAACGLDCRGLRARRAHGRVISDSEDFELLAPTTLGICCFRYVPQGAPRAERLRDAKLARTLSSVDVDCAHHATRPARRSGLLINASLRGRFALRASITNFRTTAATSITLDAVRDAASELEKE